MTTNTSNEQSVLNQIKTLINQQPLEQQQELVNELVGYLYQTHPKVVGEVLQDFGW